MPAPLIYGAAILGGAGVMFLAKKLAGRKAAEKPPETTRPGDPRYYGGPPAGTVVPPPPGRGTVAIAGIEHDYFWRPSETGFQEPTGVASIDALIAAGLRDPIKVNALLHEEWLAGRYAFQGVIRDVAAEEKRIEFETETAAIQTAAAAGGGFGDAQHEGSGGVLTPTQAIGDGTTDEEYRARIAARDAIMAGSVPPTTIGSFQLPTTDAEKMKLYQAMNGVFSDQTAVLRMWASLTGQISPV
jgi:hypothetical protein